MNESQKHYAKQKQTRHKRTLYMISLIPNTRKGESNIQQEKAHRSVASWFSVGSRVKTDQARAQRSLWG